MKLKIYRGLYFLFILTSLQLFFSCASMQVRGNTPVERALSAANLLLDGKVSDPYIKVYKTQTKLQGYYAMQCFATISDCSATVL